MKLQDIPKTTAADIDSDSILTTDVVGLKMVDLTNGIGNLSRLSLSSFIADSTPENAKNAISQLRASTAKIDTKTDTIKTHIDNVKPVNQTDVDACNFEKQADRPISLKNAIDTISDTFITTTALQAMVNDVYSALWTAVNDMLTTGFQTSMYARQYTGATQGISDANPVHTEIVIPTV